MEQVKRSRARAANFTPEEKRICLELANKYKHVIENKKTDATSKEEKDDAWSKIANEFNTLCPAMINRTSSNLKNFFDNQKRSARKQAAENRMERMRTGGGPSSEKDDPLIDMTLEIINKKTVSGLKSRFDDDAVTTLTNEVEETEKVLGLSQNSADFQESLTTSVKVNQQHSVPEEENLTIDHPDDSSSPPKNKRIEPSKRTITERTPGTSTRKIPKWSARRRPLGNTSLNLAKTYEDLAGLKTDMTQLQLQLLQKQQTEEIKRDERETEKYNLEKRALLAEIENNTEKALYWRQRREQELVKFQIEKETAILTLQLKQKELNEKLIDK